MLGNVSHVENKGDDVTLLAVVAFVVVIVFDELVSVLNIAANILEISSIKRISKNDVVGDSSDGFSSDSNFV